MSREIVEVPGAGRIVDMPGVRGLGLWDAEEGIGAAFPDVEALAAQCRFRDCTHHGEPGCAVRAAVESGPSGSDSFPATVETTDVPMPDPCVDPCNGGTGMSGLCM